MLGLVLEPDAATRLSDLSPEALQYRTFEVVRALFRRLAESGPVVVAVEDLHWADPTSVQLTESLLGLAEESAVLLLVALRPERDHPAWAVKEAGAREYPHRTREIALEALSGDAERDLLDALVGRGVLPEHLRRKLLDDAEGNPFYLEELVRSLADQGALVRDGGNFRFDHMVAVEVPPSVEKVILARIDRLTPACHEVITAASVLGRTFGLRLLEGVTGRNGDLRDPLHELERLDLVRESRRWPQPEYRFKHALIQEAAYRTLVTAKRRALHRRAAEWLEHWHGDNPDEAFGLLAHHWLEAADDEKAIDYLTRAGDKARLEYALDEAIDHYRDLLPLLETRGEEQAMALVLFKLALALHQSLRFGEANATYQQAFRHWHRPESWPGQPDATLLIASSFLPNDPDPKSAIAWPNIQLCMQLFDRLVEQWPERTIVPSLAERWEIADDGLRYVFHLREGLRWSDGEPLTAHDVEFGIKRVLNPESPGSSVAIYFVLENGQDYYLGHNADAERIGVRALDDHTVEFRLVAPAPYFMSVMNRPDGGPQPRHAVERHGASWVDPARQVVSGAFRQTERSPDRLVLHRRDAAGSSRPGNVRTVEMLRMSAREALEPYARDELDMIGVRYTPKLADLMPVAGPDASIGLAGWTFYLAFDHGQALTADVELRRALAHSVDRETLGAVAPANLLIASGGIVPPSLQGHTPDIALRFDPDRARAHFLGAGSPRTIEVAALDDWMSLVGALAETWKQVLGLQVEPRPWTTEMAVAGTNVRDLAPVVLAGWLPGYPDPEYYLRLLLQSDSLTNEGGFSHPPFDELIERARQERSDRTRLGLFHEADRMAVCDRVALIPIAYGRALSYVKPWVKGWWEFGKTSSSFADLMVTGGPRREGEAR
jgi:ABC-type oligopeptide transport system substrate-binding subunit